LNGEALERLMNVVFDSRDIADTLFVSEDTVLRQVENIFSKLSVSSRPAAVAQAPRRGLS
jgi:DNA-binding NarL/FixJ family response regulator